MGQILRIWPDKNRLMPWLVLVCFMLLLPLQSSAEDDAVFDVLSAATMIDDQVLRLDASFDLQFGDALDEALHSGVSLFLLVEIEALRKRDYVWSESIARVEQRYQINYHALTEQYVLRNINSGVRFKFPNFESLQRVVSTLVDFPFLDLGLLDYDSEYFGRIRIGLDSDQFPTPLKLMSYFSSDWDPQSEWYTWPLY
jgi:hypothetical protein